MTAPAACSPAGSLAAGGWDATVRRRAAPANWPPPPVRQQTGAPTSRSANSRSRPASACGMRRRLCKDRAAGTDSAVRRPERLLRADRLSTRRRRSKPAASSIPSTWTCPSSLPPAGRSSRRRTGRERSSASPRASGSATRSSEANWPKRLPEMNESPGTRDWTSRAVPGQPQRSSRSAKCSAHSPGSRRRRSPTDCLQAGHNCRHPRHFSQGPSQGTEVPLAAAALAQPAIGQSRAPALRPRHRQDKAICSSQPISSRRSGSPPASRRKAARITPSRASGVPRERVEGVVVIGSGQAGLRIELCPKDPFDQTLVFGQLRHHHADPRLRADFQQAAAPSRRRRELRRPVSGRVSATDCAPGTGGGCQLRIRQPRSASVAQSCRIRPVSGHRNRPGRVHPARRSAPRQSRR